MFIRDIINAYIEQSGDGLSDFNEQQQLRIAYLAYEEGHHAGLEKCVYHMYDYVSLVRYVIAKKDVK